ncbi:hypothetical protein M8C21_021089 [Ambrosia artemisiifolia]|uniref:SAP domain-containing protein n=1 Tax=Ambrosia artemisiifolia TaxID=4212 RepID=A0AAD5GDY7_AMBAR|nr:hypothetical protein M8C21_021089 [Ambrosia artemisiifolia]
MACFRLHELKDVLSQLGLPKTGKKQDLTERILTLLSDAEASGTHGHGSRKSKYIPKEDVAKTIDDIYRQMDMSTSSHQLFTPLFIDDRGPGSLLL